MRRHVEVDPHKHSVKGEGVLGELTRHCKKVVAKNLRTDTVGTHVHAFLLVVQFLQTLCQNTCALV